MDKTDPRVAIATGASAPNGIGRAIAERLARDGISVVVTDIDGTMQVDGTAVPHKELLDQVVAGIVQSGGTAMAHPLDVTNAQSIETCLQGVHDIYERVDILVNNAGSLAWSDAFLSTTPAQWQTSFDVNLLGPTMMAQAVIPEMQAQGGGRIINIGSTGSLGAEPGFGAYTAMKHGLVGFTKTLAAENNISVPEMKTRRYAHVAVRDAGMPADVANAVAYLARSEANYVTGISLPVRGGVPFGI